MKYEKEKRLIVDDLQNLVTSMNTGTDRLQQSKFVSTNFFGFYELSAMYMSWLGRRIVDLVPSEALKKGWEITCASWDSQKIERLNTYCENVLQLRTKLDHCLKSQRCFGGALMVAIVNQDFGAFANPIPNFLTKNSLLGLQPFDAWQCAPGVINYMNPLAKNFRYPEVYSIGTTGMNVISGNTDNTITPAGTQVHWSRVERFDGLFLPWYERVRNLYWGQSLLASAFSSVRNAESVDSSIATLLFRASVPVLKVKDLQDIVSDPESRAAFLERVNLMNYGMSNNHMAIIDSDETLESFEPGAITNLDSILERYYILVSAATGIPVSKLIGESAKGLNATGEGDLNNYYDMIEDYQTSQVQPALMSMFKRWIIPSLFDELMPSDFKIRFPALERTSAKEKQDTDNTFLSMINTALEAGLIDKKVARREIHSKGIFETFDDDDVKRIEGSEGENEIDLEHALDIADQTFEAKHGFKRRMRKNGKSKEN